MVTRSRSQDPVTSSRPQAEEDPVRRTGRHMEHVLRKRHLSSHLACHLGARQRPGQCGLRRQHRRGDSDERHSRSQGCVLGWDQRGSYRWLSRPWSATRDLRGDRNDEGVQDVLQRADARTRRGRGPHALPRSLGRSTHQTATGQPPWLPCSPHECADGTVCRLDRFLTNARRANGQRSGQRPVVGGQVRGRHDCRRMVWMSVVRSPYAHARIGGGALAHRGVIAAFSREELAGEWQASLPCAWLPTEDARQPNHRPLAVDEARYVGDGVAVVIAESREAARDAAELVQVDYEPLPTVVDPEHALAEGAPLVHEEFGTNRCYRWALSADCSFHVTERNGLVRKATGR